jgi:hypothetical protein
MDNQHGEAQLEPVISVPSRQVSWFPVYEFATQLLTPVHNWPAAGTPAWQELPDNDPRKLAAVIEAGVHWSLRIDAEQEARARASRDIAASSDWPALARNLRRQPGPAYVPRERRTA